MSVFKDTKSFYTYELSDQVSENLRRRLDYGFLEMQAYTNVKFDQPTSGYCNLKQVYDDRHGNRVFEGLGPSWIWEDNVSINGSGNLPIVASGIYIDNTFYNPSNLTYPFYIDYANGRIVFTENVPSGSQVSAEYTFRDIAVYPAESPEWRTVVSSYLENFESLEELSPSGMASILKQNRVWLPAVFVEIQDYTNEPMQLGGGEIAKVGVYYHVFSDKPHSARRICDVLNNDKERTIYLFNINLAPFPLRNNGSIGSNPITYQNLADPNGPYFWTGAYIEDSDGGPVSSSTDIYRGEVRQFLDVYRYPYTY